MRLDSDVQISEFVSAKDDMSGADVKAICTEAGLLALYQPYEVWFEFGVDGESLDVFRRARQIVEERGFATRWGPLELDFPVRFALNDQTDGPAPRDILAKPRR